MGWMPPSGSELSVLYNLFSRRKKRTATAASAPVDGPIVETVSEPVDDTTATPDAAVPSETTGENGENGEDRFVVIEPLPEAEADAGAEADAEAAADADADADTDTDTDTDDNSVAGIDAGAVTDDAPGTDSPLTAAPNVEIGAAPDDGFVPERPDMEDASAEDLTTLTVPMLRLRAREVGVTGYSRMKKSELIVAIAAKSAE
jgi:hypothetical protein